MITSRKAILKKVTDKTFEPGNFYLMREGSEFAYVQQQGDQLQFSPCDEDGKVIVAETVTYQKSTGRRAVAEFVKMLPFQITVQYDIKGFSS